MAFDEELYQALSHSEAEHRFRSGWRRILSKLLEHCCPEDASLPLDLGCGTASNRETLLNFAERVIGIDWGWEELRSPQPLDSSSPCQADAIYLPFPGWLLLCSVKYGDDECLVDGALRLLEGQVPLPGSSRILRRFYSIAGSSLLGVNLATEMRIPICPEDHDRGGLWVKSTRWHMISV